MKYKQTRAAFVDLNFMPILFSDKNLIFEKLQDKSTVRVRFDLEHDYVFLYKYNENGFKQFHYLTPDIESAVNAAAKELNRDFYIVLAKEDY